jgi:hypothetical protein
MVARHYLLSSSAKFIFSVEHAFGQCHFFGYRRASPATDDSEVEMIRARACIGSIESETSGRYWQPIFVKLSKVPSTRLCPSRGANIDTPKRRPESKGVSLGLAETADRRV